MKYSLQTFALTMSLMIAGTTFANTSDKLLCKFAPENTMQIPIGYEKAGSNPGLDEKLYNTIIDRVENYYKPIVAKKGAVLKINRMWTTNTVNSTAHQSGKNWFVDAYGGLARYPGMTQDGEMAVLCHEMGHHLGGFPKINGFMSKWASNEGQADYYATMKCFRLLTANDDNGGIMSSATIPKEVNSGCEKTFKSSSEIALCQREAMAGKILAQILYELGRGSSKGASAEPATPPSFGTPDMSKVSTTNDQHPMAQCRLDTYFAGSICGIAASEEFSQTEGVTGACAQEKHDAYGFRPNCWYKPAH